MTAKNKLLIIVGPTCSGKSGLAMAISERFDGEIVSCDSIQMYRGFDVGSAKPSVEMRRSVPHHLIDCLNFQDKMDAAKYAQLARGAIETIWGRRKTAVVVAGSGLYLRALWGRNFHANLPSNSVLRERLARRDGEYLYRLLTKLDPDRANQLHRNDIYRITRALELRILSKKRSRDLFACEERKWSNAEDSFGRAVKIYLKPDVSKLAVAIEERTKAMLGADLIEEVRGLVKQGCSPECPPMQSIGYKQTVDFINRRETCVKDLENKITIATRQYAKRQKTWFNALSHDILQHKFGQELVDPKNPFWSDLSAILN